MRKLLFPLLCGSLLSLAPAVSTLLAPSPALAQGAAPAKAQEVLPLNIFKNLKEGKKQTVLVYGTSLSINGAWAKALNAYFDQQFPGQVTFINSAKAGMQSRWGVQNLQERVLDKKPDLVFIEFSINDASINNKIPVEQSAANLDQMVKALREQNPQVDIVLQTMNVAWDSTVSAPKKYGSDRPDIVPYYEVYRRYAQEHALPLVDNYPNWLKIQQEDPKKYQEMVPDGIHPSPDFSTSVTWTAVQGLLEKARASSGATATVAPAATAPTAPGPIALPTKESFHIYLLMGQSNMVGRDTRGMDPQVTNSHILAMNGQGQWVIAKNPLHEDARIAPGVGPGLSFAQEMAKADPNVTIGLVPCAVGGTPLRRWVKGADLYENAITRAKAAAQVGVIEGVLWHQGEAETEKQENADTYETRLTQMFKDLRTDLGSPNLPIVVGQLGEFLSSEKYPYVDTVRAALKHMPADLPKVGYADSTGFGDKGDKLHFSVDSQKQFGQRYATAMQELLKTKTP